VVVLLEVAGLGGRSRLAEAFPGLSVHVLVRS